MTTPDLAGALEALRRRVADLRLDLATPGADAARTAQTEFVGQVDDYLLPRLRRLDAPLLAVVGGSTGAGKSTLVNTLVGAAVSRSGWLRPTTRGPVLVCNPTEVDWFTGDRILPELSRTTGDGGVGSAGTLNVVPHDRVPRGLALLDAPDIDSVVAENRRLAGQLLSAADLWIFCTSAARYADAVPWDLLHTAQQRSTALAVVLNRVPPGGVREISSHLASMLDENGLGRATLFAVPETELQGETGLLPERVVAPLNSWLMGLAADADARADVIRTTLDGALQSLRQRVTAIAREVDDQLATAAVLRDEADTAYEDAIREVDDGVRSGSVLRGEVLARWQEFVGTGELTRNLEERIGRLVDRVGGVPHRPAAADGRRRGGAGEQPRGAGARGCRGRRRAGRGRVAGAARRPCPAHRPGAHARARLAGVPPGARARGPGLAGGHPRARRGQGRERRTAARLATFGTNGAGLVLMLAVFAHTGGLTGTEVLVAGGTTAASHKVLEAVFGDSAVRALAATARADLLERVEALLAPERARFEDLVATSSPSGAAAVEVRAALDGFEAARRASRTLTRPGTRAAGASR